MSYKQLFEDDYIDNQRDCTKLQYISYYIDNQRDCTKLQYISDYIFHFTTYDSAVSQLFAKDTLEVLEQVINRTTFEYIENNDNYIKYLTVINWLKPHNLFEWGTSIRGAWFNDEAEFFIGGNVVTIGNLEKFFTELIEWSKE
jgi:hypothetical protein